MLSYKNVKYKETETDSLILKTALTKQGFRSQVFEQEVFKNI